jgi:hypothetical protein
MSSEYHKSLRTCCEQKNRIYYRYNLGRNVASQKTEQDDVLRAQRLQVCEIVVAQGIEKNDESALRWFTREVLHLPWTWGPVVAMALLDKTKSGEYRWRSAKNPLGCVRVIAYRSALKWNPELLFGRNADKVLRPFERAVSTLHGPSEGGSISTYADAEDENTAGGYWHDEFIDRAGYEASREYDVLEVWEEMDDSLIATEDDSLSFDWDAIGRRIGLTPDEATLMKARAQGVTRADLGKHLLWDEQKVERVWRAVNRYLEKPEMAAKVRATLCAPEKKLAAGRPQTRKTQHV